MNVANTKSRPYTLVDIGLNWDGINKGPIDLRLFAKNVLDKTYVSGPNLVNYVGLGLGTVYYGEPRTYGLQLRYRFGGAAL